MHKGIYAIFSRNLTTGRTETLVDSSPGGASRPELSRDGKTLAYVTRVRDKEALVLKYVDIHRPNTAENLTCRFVSEIWKVVQSIMHGTVSRTTCPVYQHRWEHIHRLHSLPPMMQ